MVFRDLNKFLKEQIGARFKFALENNIISTANLLGVSPSDTIGILDRIGFPIDRVEFRARQFERGKQADQFSFIQNLDSDEIGDDNTIPITKKNLKARYNYVSEYTIVQEDGEFITSRFGVDSNVVLSADQVSSLADEQLTAKYPLEEGDQIVSWNIVGAERRAE